MLAFATMMLPPRLFRPLTALAGAALLGVVFGQSDFKSRMLAMLPENAQNAEVMAWVPDPEVVAIKERIRQAQQQDPRWFREYAAEHADDPVPPWHPKFGVTESEYARTLSPDWLHLEKTGKQVRLFLSRTGNKVVFQGGPGAEALRGLTLDVSTGEVRIPEGFSAKPRTVDLSEKDDHIGLGARKGWGWSFEGVNLKTHVAVKANLNLLQLASGGVVLAYNRGSTLDFKRQPEVNLTLVYDKKVDFSKR